jgi:hypothetical protein
MFISQFRFTSLSTIYIYSFCLKFFIFLYLIMHNSFLYAQVNIETARPSDTDGARMSLDMGMNLIRGNVNLSQINLGTRVQYIKGIHSPFVQASLSYGEKEEEAFLNQSFLHVRWTAMWWKHFGSEVFSQLQKDAFRSLVLRQLYGMGIRGLMYQNHTFDIAMGSGYMLEKEIFLENGIEKLDINHRSTSYLTFHYKLKTIPVYSTQLKSISKEDSHHKCLKYKDKPKYSTLVSLNNTTYIQPLFNQIKDVRFLNDLSLTIHLSTHVQLLETLSIMYDSRPPPDVKNTDLKNMTALRIKF